MHKNLLWQAFLVVMLTVSVGYSGLAIYRYYAYERLKAETHHLTMMQWTILEAAEDEFTLKVDYQFQVEQKNYAGMTEWPKDRYLNRYAAEQATNNFKKHSWSVYYDPTNPHYSNLEKNFPFKEFFSIIVLWGLFLYFIWLGYYVARYKS